VSIWSQAAPDLRAICRSALGCDVAASEPIGKGSNSRVFRVDLDEGGPTLPRQVVVKFYRSDVGDTRDRLCTEFESLQFLWQNSVRSIPSPIAIDRDRQCAIYEYIDGDAASATAVEADDIDASVDFLGVLKDLRAAAGAEALAPASEACFSLDDIVASLDRRLERLRQAPADHPDVVEMWAWVDRTLLPLKVLVQEWCRSVAHRSRIAPGEKIGADARTLSPSDFGFHNAIRRHDGTLAFVDFEYFGWDDPAKTIVDFLLHPGMMLSDALKCRFATRMHGLFADVPAFADRVRIAYPLFGLKWALILLNDFLPERFLRSNGAQRATGLAKARSLMARVAVQYANNPLLP
jgi:hypothetical protein